MATPGKHRITFALLITFLCATTLPAANIPVSTAAQISAAMATAHPGDTLSMIAGTWTNQKIVFQGNGTASQPIVLRAQGGYGTVILNGTSTLRIAGNYLVADGLLFDSGYSSSGDVIEFRYSSSGIISNYSRLTNSAIFSYNPANDSTDYKWISLYGKYNRIDHCRVEGKTHSGATLVVWRPTTAANYHLIDHNYFGPRPVLGYNGGETIRVGTSDQSLSSSYTVVEYNYFYKCDGEIETISSKSCNNTYRYNTFVECQGTITLRHGNFCRVEGNFFFANHVPNSGGVRIIGEDHTVVNNYIAGTNGNSLKSALTLMDGIPGSPLNGYYQVKRAVVAFNTLVDNREPLNLGGGKSTSNTLPPLDCTIANNIVLGTVSPLITQTDTTINTTWLGNIFYGATLGMSPVPSGITITDPVLESAGPDNLRHISGSSPAVDAGEGSFPSVILDMDGQNRDSSKDIGADEYSTAAVTIRPLTPSDVGPVVREFTIVVVQSEHGTVTPGDTITVSEGETSSFTFHPDAWYRVDSVIVDGINYPDSVNGFTFTGISTYHTIRVTFVAVPYSASVVHSGGWHMISIPLDIPGVPVALYYPDASAKAFSYNGSYHPVETLDHGTGYWVKFPSADTTVFTGTPSETDTLTVNARWNLIGSVSHPLPADSVTSEPPGLIVSRFFGYDGTGYITADTLKPGTGYWVKSASSGKLILNSRIPAPGSARIKPILNDSHPPDPPMAVEYPGKPTEFLLDPVWPNPFNPAMNVRFIIPARQAVSLKVYNIIGIEIASLVDRMMDAGTYTLQWSPSTENLAGGVYFLRLSSEESVAIQRAVFIK